MTLNLKSNDSNTSLVMVSNQTQIDRYLRIVSHESHPELERRKSKRYSLTCTVTVQPVDEFLHPAGKYFQALCSNISAEGIQLIHNEKITSELIFIEIPKMEAVDRICVQAKVKRCIHYVNDLYVVGCEFILDKSLDSKKSE